MHDIRVRLGEVRRIEAAERFRPSDGSVTLRVTGVRLVANRPERDAWLWLEGVKVASGGRAGTLTQILVRASMLAGERSAS